MYGRFQEYLKGELDRIRAEGLYKTERVLMTSQGVEIRTEGWPKVLNFCANNYLGLCSEPRVMAAANYSFFRLGYGMASVRFICGTSEVHKELERRMSEFLGTDDTLLYSSAFDAKLSQNFADALLEEGIYVIGFYYQVVPRGKSRIRVQVSAAHTPEQIDFAIAKFAKTLDAI